MTVSEHQSTHSPDVQSTDAQVPIVHDILEAAQVLRCGRSTVYQLMDAGEVVSIKIGRRRLVTHESLIRFVERKAATTLSPAS